MDGVRNRQCVCVCVMAGEEGGGLVWVVHHPVQRRAQLPLRLPHLARAHGQASEGVLEAACVRVCACVRVFKRVGCGLR